MGFLEHDKGKHDEAKIFLFLVMFLLRFKLPYPMVHFFECEEASHVCITRKLALRAYLFYVLHVRFPWHQARWPQSLLSERVEREGTVLN